MNSTGYLPFWGTLLVMPVGTAIVGYPPILLRANIAGNWAHVLSPIVLLELAAVGFIGAVSLILIRAILKPRRPWEIIYSLIGLTLYVVPVTLGEITGAPLRALAGNLLPYAASTVLGVLTLWLIEDRLASPKQP